MSKSIWKTKPVPDEPELSRYAASGLDERGEDESGDRFES